MATLGIEESDHYKEMAFVELSKQESNSWDKKVADVERWPLVEI